MGLAARVVGSMDRAANANPSRDSVKAPAPEEVSKLSWRPQLHRPVCTKTKLMMWVQATSRATRGPSANTDDGLECPPDKHICPYGVDSGSQGLALQYCTCIPRHGTMTGAITTDGLFR